MNKKGIQTDLLFVVGGLFILALVMFFTFHIFETVKVALNETAVNQTRVDAIFDYTTTTTKIFDFIFPAVLTGLMLFMVVSAFFIDTHPIFFFSSILVLVVALVVAPPIANTFEEIVNEAVFVDTKAEFPVTNFIFDKYPLFILSMSLPVGVVLFGKARR